MRRLVSETSLSVESFVYPLFICPGTGIKTPIASMEGCFHYSPDMLGAEIDQLAEVGVNSVLLFGAVDKKDDTASYAYDPKGAVQQAIGQIKKINNSMLVITDVCLCAYTSHGHCGLLKDGRVDNDSSLPVIAKAAVSYAAAGADIVAPSDMMDGRVGAIRSMLDENAFQDTAIMAYSAKYASAFYGPFRGAANSAPAAGDRKSYQMDPSAARQAMCEIRLDIAEGADMVMIKPAMAYLDIIAAARGQFEIPIAAYNVSGEYMMIHAGAKAGVLDLNCAMMESLMAIRRAGADIIITYFAKTAAKLLKGGRH